MISQARTQLTVQQETTHEFQEGKLYEIVEAARANSRHIMMRFVYRGENEEMGNYYQFARIKDDEHIEFVSLFNGNIARVIGDKVFSSLMYLNPLVIGQKDIDYERFFRVLNQEGESK